MVPGAGCDELILLCAPLALGRGDTAIVAKPTYQMYAVVDARRRAPKLEAVAPPRAASRSTYDGVLERAPARAAGLALLAQQPDRRGGPARRRERLCRRARASCVVDQAYLEFGGEDLSDLIARHENLVVAARSPRAGRSPRCGSATRCRARRSPARSTRCGRRARSRSQSAAAAELALRHARRHAGRRRRVRAERDRLRRGVAALGLEVVGEAGNYVTFRVPLDAERGVRRARARAAAWCAASATSRCSRASSAPPSRRRPRTTGCVDGARGDAGARRHRPPPAAAPAGRLGTARHRVAPHPRDGDRRARSMSTAAGRARVATGVGFLDHMLPALATHGLLDLDLSCSGDLHVDEHHTVEDCGIALGQALDRALGDRAGIRRFGDARAPLDEALATLRRRPRRAAASPRIDLALSRRSRSAASRRALWPHLLDSFARAGRINLHLTSTRRGRPPRRRGGVQGAGLALRAACARDPRRGGAAVHQGRSVGRPESCWSTTAPATCARCARRSSGPAPSARVATIPSTVRRARGG